MWGRQVYRWSDLDFEANAREGIGVDWPIRYADIAPWYDHVETFVGISGQAEGLPQLPDGKFLKPMALNCVEQSVREAVGRAWPGERMVTIGRCAVLTEPHKRPRRLSLLRAVPPRLHHALVLLERQRDAARRAATGRLTLRPYSVVHSITYDKRRGRATGVRVIDGQTKHAIEFQARIIFLCASTIESARILLNSGNGFANSSGQVGKNLMDHIMGGGANGRMDGPAEPRFHRQSSQRDLRAALPQHREGQVQIPPRLWVSGRWRPLRLGTRHRAGWLRAEYKQSLRKPGPWGMAFTASAKCCRKRRTSLRSTRTRWTRGAFRSPGSAVRTARMRTRSFTTCPSPPPRCSPRRGRTTSSRTRATTRPDS